MVTPQTIDIDALLSPVSEEQPCGVDLRADASPTSPYYTIKDARRAARDKERAGSMEDLEIPDTRAEWRPVYAQAQTLLSEQSKDLEIIAWFVEAAARLEGFAGLRDAFHLVRRTVETYWDGCYPLLEDDDIEERVSPLSGLNGVDGEGTLLVPIRNIVITEGNSVGPYALWHYQQAVALQQVADPEARQRKIESGSTTLEQVERAGLETDQAFFKTLHADIEACIEEYAQLTQTLDELCGNDSPPSSSIRRELSAALDAVVFIAKDALEDPTAQITEDAAENGETAVDGAPATTGSVSTQGLQSREEAFRVLLQVADFFRRTEPHSPLSYALEQSVRWGRMPLPALLNELVGDTTTRDDIFRMTGIQESTESDDGYSEE